MKLLKSRAFLIPAAIVIILVVGVVSAFSDLKSDINKTEELYYKGVKAENGGYLRPSISNQMRNKVATVNSVLGVIDQYAELSAAADALRTARDHVFEVDDAKYNKNTIRSMSAANDELLLAVEKLRTELEGVALPEREQKALDRYLKDLDGAQNIIENSGYNEAVTEFNMGPMQRFPAKQMLALMKNRNGGASPF